MQKKFMELAFKLAQKAGKQKEVPVGAVVVCNNKVIAMGYNKREKKQNAILHAEIIAINKACKKLKSWRLDDCEIYITLEPCCMCTGAIINSRIKTVYFGAYDINSGCMGSVIKPEENNKLFNKLVIKGGIMEKECAEILKNFFKQLRKK